MMLYAATNGTMSGYDKSKESFQVLHHVLHIVSTGGIDNVRFPNDFAHAVLLLSKFIQRERRSMFEERDEGGSLPIHIAVSGERLLRQTNDTNNNAQMEETAEGNDGGEEGGEDGAGGDHQDDNAQQQLQNVNNNMEAMELGDAQQQQQQQNNGPQPEGQPAVPAPAVVGGAQQQEEDDEEEDEEEDEDEDDEDSEEGGDNNEMSSIMPSDMELIHLLLDQHPASIRLRDSRSGSLPVHLALEHNPRAVEAIEYFLELHPRSVTMPDGNGRLPIHLALIKESPTWNKILSLSPLALEARDPVTGLLPFQLAAMSKTKSKKDRTTEVDEKMEDSDGQELDSLTTAYRLLRMSPCLAAGLVPNIKPRAQSMIEQQIMIGYKPRVTRLEEENERLRRKVEELERKLQSMQTNDLDQLKSSFTTSPPSLKKRKSIAGSRC